MHLALQLGVVFVRNKRDDFSQCVCARVLENNMCGHMCCRNTFDGQIWASFKLREKHSSMLFKERLKAMSK
jgi:hypothetical protein